MALHASDNQMIPTSLALLAQNSTICPCAVGAVSNQALFEQVPVVESLGSEQLQRFVASD